MVTSVRKPICSNGTSEMYSIAVPPASCLAEYVVHVVVGLRRDAGVRLLQQVAPGAEP